MRRAQLGGDAVGEEADGEGVIVAGNFVTGCVPTEQEAHTKAAKRLSGRNGFGVGHIGLDGKTLGCTVRFRFPPLSSLDTRVRCRKNAVPFVLNCPERESGRGPASSWEAPCRDGFQR